MFFLKHSPQPTNAQHICKACKGHELEPYVKASQHGVCSADNDYPILFYRCLQCGSINEFSKEQDFYIARDEKAFANFYLDVGAGIEEMIDPIARFSGSTQYDSPSGKTRSFLELGCGFGFAVDYTRKILGWQSEGIEPSSYGCIGSKGLGIKIDATLLGEGSDADGRKFDCIYASEVLEHIQDPDHFLRTCRNHLNDDGVLIMTTPAAEYINDQNPRNEVYACLFPGEHKIIFSATGLEASLLRTGFKFFSLEKRRGSNWVIIASPHRAVEPIYGEPSSGIRSGQQYYTYLRHILADRSTNDSPEQRRIRLAICFRLVKYLTNQGCYDESVQILREWYNEIAACADPELASTSSNQSPPQDNESLLCILLSLCLIGLTRERIEVEIKHQPYPKAGAAFLKTLGFFIATIALNTPNSTSLMRFVSCFLEALIDYGIYTKDSEEPFFHLELIGLIEPAKKLLELAKTRLELENPRIVRNDTFKGAKAMLRPLFNRIMKRGTHRINAK